MGSTDVRGREDELRHITRELRHINTSKYK